MCVCVFESVFSPMGWQNTLNRCCKSNLRDIIDGTMVLVISKCQCDTENTIGAFKNVPDLFWNGLLIKTVRFRRLRMKHATTWNTNLKH